MMKARTTKEISGHAIKAIPAGTTFQVDRVGKYFSPCTGLPITMIYNDEFELIAKQTDNPEPAGNPA